MGSRGRRGGSMIAPSLALTLDGLLVLAGDRTLRGAGLMGSYCFQPPPPPTSTVTTVLSAQLSDWRRRDVSLPRLSTLWTSHRSCFDTCHRSKVSKPLRCCLGDPVATVAVAVRNYSHFHARFPSRHETKTHYPLHPRDSGAGLRYVTGLSVIGMDVI